MRFDCLLPFFLSFFLSSSFNIERCHFPSPVIEHFLYDAAFILKKQSPWLFLFLVFILFPPIIFFHNTSTTGCSHIIYSFC
eukprot:18014_5